ncbi:MAG: phage tail tape measure protein [Cellvibrionaceae bacterium]
MSTRLEKLMFSIGLIDRTTGPAGKIMSRFDQMQSRINQGMLKTGAGAAGLFATSRALSSMLAPSIEMDRAMGEVRSLGVADQALKKLERTALSTSIKYGISATDMVRSSYDIQSAIAGLSGQELSRFTEASNILAKGTKSDAGTITDYMGTMYGIFQNSANAMGKSQWVEMLTGQTANAVQMFKTTGAEMAGAFANLGAEAQSHGVGMSEQMAILGTLQATMSGSEAGTKYKAFLAGVGKAQDELNLRFTDSQGKLLPMVDILDKVKGKFGETFDVAESDALKKAFGSKEATGLIKLLMQNTDGLSESIDGLGKVKGMKKAEDMAKEMADPWERLSALGNALKTVFGRVIQPVLIPVIESLMEGGETVMRWTEMFPNLTRVVGIGILTVFGLVAAVSAFSLVSGTASLVVAGLAPILGAARIAMLLFNATLWANPITWVVGGVLLLGAALVGLAVYWDDVMKALDGSVFFQLLRLQIQMISGAVSALWKALLFLGDGVTLIIDGWKLLFDVLGITAAFNGVLLVFEAVGNSIKTISNGVGWLIDKLISFRETLAGVLKGVADNGLLNTVVKLFTGGDLSLSLTETIRNIGNTGADSAGLIEKVSGFFGAKGVVPSLNEKGNTPDETNYNGVATRESLGLVANRVPNGGLQQEFNSGTHIEKVEVNTTGGVNGFDLQDELQMAGA